MRHGEIRRGVHASQPATRSAQHGLGWLHVLISLALLSAAGAVVAQRWSDQISREKEQDLLRIGDEFSRALAAYRSASPGGEKRYPNNLEQLVLDTRFVGTRRYMRKVYRDPITAQADWVLLRDARGNILGVSSRSLRTPWLRVAQRLTHTDLPPVARYADWVFTPREVP